MGEWEFEKEDFMTTAPYEALYQYHSQPFIHEVKLRELSAYAKTKGFKSSVNSMYRRYVESLKVQSNTVYIDNETQFSDSPLVLDAGEWETDDEGVRKKFGYDTAIACSHPILPVERLVNIDTGMEKLTLAFRHGINAPWRRVVVDKDDLKDARSVTSLYKKGISVTSENAKFFVKYIQELEDMNRERIPERKSIGRLGYIPGEGFSPFVEGLIFDGDANYAALFRSVHAQGSEKAWLETAAEARAMSTTAKIMLAASFASVLLEPINSLPFFVHLWGVDSGTGKTVALMLAGSVWGNPRLGAYLKTFDATDVGLEKTAAFLNSLPLCLDELQLSKDEKGRSKFNVYKLAQGVGRTRGNRGGGIDFTPTWHNCTLTTGESPLTGQTSGAGAVNRVIDIECTKYFPAINDGTRISALLKKHYGFAGRKFVKILYSDESIVEKATERYHELFRSLSERDTTEKQAMAAAAIILADELACAWIFEGREKPLTCEEMSAFLASKAAVSAGNRAYQFLCDWVTQNSNRLCGKSDTVDVLGALEEGKAYIIRSVFEQVLQNAGFSMQSTVSYLKQERLIKTRGRNNTRSKRINGIPTECFCLLLPVADEIDGEEHDELPL